MGWARLERWSSSQSTQNAENWRVWESASAGHLKVQNIGDLDPEAAKNDNGIQYAISYAHTSVQQSPSVLKLVPIWTECL